LGIGFIVAYLKVFYEDVRFIVTMIIQLFIYTLPIFYTVEQVLGKGNRTLNLYLLNPVATFMVTYQRALLGPPVVYAPDGRTRLSSVGIPWNHLLLSAAVSVAVLILGFYCFERHKSEMAERL